MWNKKNALSSPLGNANLTLMFGTLDFGRSDIWHFNFALKFFLSQTLKNGSLPLWSKDLGTGFPVFAEGQIGLFNLYNFFAFRFLDLPVAFDLAYVVMFSLCALGAYLYARTIKLSKLSSFFFAGTLSLSAPLVTHIAHFNLLQAITLMPLEFFLVEKFLQSSKIGWLVVFSFVLSQQIYAGFQQSVLISLIGVYLYFLLRLKNFRQFFLIFSLAMATVFGFLLAAPQIIATWQLTGLSYRFAGTPLESIMAFPLNPKHLITYVFPYFFGDPRRGTYPPFSADWGIFWESIGYVGIVPLLFGLAGLFRPKKNPLYKPMITIFLISLILTLGKYTPFFFLFQLPPLFLFRVPSRFLFLLDWALLVLAAIKLDSLKNSRLKLTLVVISLLDIGYFAVTYNPVVDPQTWLSPPRSVQILKTDPSWFRIYDVSPAFAWNKIYLSRGWQNPNLYLNFRNMLDPNQNLYWSVPSADIYSGMSTRRMTLFNLLIFNGSKSDPDKGTFSISSGSAKLLSLEGVKYLTSPYLLKDKGNLDLTLYATISGTPTVYLYKNARTLPHAYLTRNYVVSSSMDDIQAKLINTNLNAVILEEPVALPVQPGPLIPADVILNSDQEVRIRTTASSSALLILSDSYYPGWEATIDNQPTKIYPANLNERAVIFPAGEHEVIFRYEPFKNLLTNWHL